MRNLNFAATRNRFISCSGSPKHKLYSPSIGDDGSIVLTECGVEDTDEIIEAYRSSTELSSILARFANGDSSALNKYQGFYADLTTFPKDYRAALDSVIKAEGAFMVLPKEVREKYGNDWSKWLTAAGSKEWLELMGFAPNEPIKSDEKEIVPDEQEH